MSRHDMTSFVNIEICRIIRGSASKPKHIDIKALAELPASLVAYFNKESYKYFGHDLGNAID